MFNLVIFICQAAAIGVPLCVAVAFDPPVPTLQACNWVAGQLMEQAKQDNLTVSRISCREVRNARRETLGYQTRRDQTD